MAHVKLKLEEFKAHLPLIHAMLNPGMRERHWRKVKDEAGRSVQPNEMSTLHSLIEQQVGDHLAIIQEASETASKEHSLEKALDRMLGARLAPPGPPARPSAQTTRTPTRTPTRTRIRTRTRTCTRTRTRSRSRMCMSM